MKVEGSARLAVAVAVERGSAGVNDGGGGSRCRGVGQPQIVCPLRQAPEPAVGDIEIETGVPRARNRYEVIARSELKSDPGVAAERVVVAAHQRSRDVVDRQHGVEGAGLGRKPLGKGLGAELAIVGQRERVDINLGARPRIKLLQMEDVVIAREDVFTRQRAAHHAWQVVGVPEPQHLTDLPHRLAEVGPTILALAPVDRGVDDGEGVTGNSAVVDPPAGQACHRGSRRIVGNHPGVTRSHGDALTGRLNKPDPGIATEQIKDFPDPQLLLSRNRILQRVALRIAAVISAEVVFDGVDDTGRTEGLRQEVEIGVSLGIVNDVAHVIEGPDRQSTQRVDTVIDITGHQFVVEFRLIPMSSSSAATTICLQRNSVGKGHEAQRQVLTHSVGTDETISLNQVQITTGAGEAKRMAHFVNQDFDQLDIADVRHVDADLAREGQERVRIASSTDVNRTGIRERTACAVSRVIAKQAGPDLDHDVIDRLTGSRVDLIRQVADDHLLPAGRGLFGCSNSSVREPSVKRQVNRKTASSWRCGRHNLRQPMVAVIDQDVPVARLIDRAVLGGVVERGQIARHLDLGPGIDAAGEEEPRLINRPQRLGGGKTVMVGRGFRHGDGGRVDARAPDFEPIEAAVNKVTGTESQRCPVGRWVVCHGRRVFLTRADIISPSRLINGDQLVETRGFRGGLIKGFAIIKGDLDDVTSLREPCCDVGWISTDGLWHNGGHLLPQAQPHVKAEAVATTKGFSRSGSQTGNRLFLRIGVCLDGTRNRDPVDVVRQRLGKADHHLVLAGEVVDENRTRGDWLVWKTARSTEGVGLPAAADNRYAFQRRGIDFHAGGEPQRHLLRGLGEFRVGGDVRHVKRRVVGHIGRNEVKRKHATLLKRLNLPKRCLTVPWLIPFSKTTAP